MLSVGAPVNYEYDILTKVSQEDILYFYLGISKVPTVISNPLRKDTNPSLGLFYAANGTICYRDFATGQCSTILKLLAELYNVSRSQILNNIYENLVVNTSTEFPPLLATTPSHRQAPRSKSPVIDLKVTLRSWKTWDKEYWGMYGISRKTLQFCNVYPISHIFFNKADGSSFVTSAEKYAYAYVEFKDNIPTIKIYQPFSTAFKWINKHTADVWDLWQQLPPSGDILIITSSRKDAMCIWENTGIPACSLQAESYLPKEHVVEELKSRFTKVYVLYDNDFTQDVNRGKEYGKLFAKTFNITQLEFPPSLESKDSSDLCKSKGREVLKDTILNLITNKI